VSLGWVRTYSAKKTIGAFPIQAKSANVAPASTLPVEKRRDVSAKIGKSSGRSTGTTAHLRRGRIEKSRR
jgi:hypothetical protein